MSFYLTDKNVTKAELKEILEEVISCMDIGEAYYDIENRDLLRKIVKPKFLPKVVNDE